MTRKKYIEAREAAAEPYVTAMRSPITRVCMSLIRAGIEARHASAIELRMHVHGEYQLMEAVVTEGAPILEKLHDLTPLEADDLDVYQWEREVLDDAVTTCKAFIDEWRNKENSL